MSINRETRQFDSSAMSWLAFYASAAWAGLINKTQKTADSAMAKGLRSYR